MELEIREFIAYLHDIKKTSINTEMSYQRDLKKMWDFLKNRGIHQGIFSISLERRSDHQ